MIRRHFFKVIAVTPFFPYLKFLPKRKLKVGDRVTSNLVPRGKATIIRKLDKKELLNINSKTWDYYYPNWKNKNVFQIRYDQPHPYITEKIFNEVHTEYCDFTRQLNLCFRNKNFFCSEMELELI